MRLADRLRSALREPPQIPLLKGDFGHPAASPIPAAVLIAVTDRPEPGVILTRRRDHLRTHAGQIAFPGGRIDPPEGPTAAAIREAHEEIGLDPSLVDLVSPLEPFDTITNYSITPVVAVVPPDLELSPHEPEVAEWFEVPLAYLVDRNNHVLQSSVFAGQQRDYYEIMWGNRRIWGATAAIIVNLSRRLQWP